MSRRSNFAVILVVSCSALTVDLNAQVERQMRIFDLAPLERPDVLRSGLLPDTPGSREGGRDVPDDLGFDEDLADTSPWLAPSLLERAIRRFIAEDSWRNVRNELTAEDNGRLIVVQTPEVLEQAERFIRFLESRCARLVAIELALVPPEVLDGVAPGWDRAGSDPWLDAATLDKALETGRQRASLLSAIAPEGAWKCLQPRWLARHLVDYEVSCTGVVPVVNPWVRTIPAGAFGEAIVLPSADRSWCRVDLRLGEARRDEKPERRTLTYGDLELLRHENSHVGTVVAAPFDKVVLLGVFRSTVNEDAPGPRSFAALLRVRRLGEESAAREEGVPAAIDASFLLEPRTRFALGELVIEDDTEESHTFEFTGDDEEPSASLVDRDSLLDSLYREILEETREEPNLALVGGTLFIDPAPRIVTAAVRCLEGIARRQAQLLAVDLWQVSVSEEELARMGKGGAKLDTAWLRSVRGNPGYRSRVVGLSGWELTLGAVAGRNFVADVEHVSGGTGKLIIEVGDPVVRAAEGGLLVTARAEPVPGTSWVQLHLRGQSGRPPVFQRQTRSRSSQGVKVKQAGSGESEVEPDSGWIVVDLPDQDADSWEHLVTVSPGKPTLLGKLPDTSHRGRTRVLVATVHLFSSQPTGAHSK